MLKSILTVSLLLSLGSGGAHAQGSMASETFKQRLRGQYLQNDTAQAIINLYSRRQAGGAGWITAAALAAIRIGTASGSTIGSGPYAVRQDPPGVGAAFVSATPFVAYGIGKIVHYSNGNLEHILTDYAAGKPLARSVRRKLKTRFFAQPIIKVQPVK